MIKDVLRCSRDIRLYYDRSLDEYGVSTAQIFVLEYIYEHPGIYAQRVVELFNLEKSAISKSLRRLAEAGYIRAEDDEKDRRAKKLYANPSAKAVLDRMVETQNELDKVISNSLGENDIAFLEGLLNNVCSALGDNNK